MNERRADRGLLVFFTLNYLAQGLSGFAYEPISFLLKDGLRLSPAESARFVSLMTLPFLLKPILGAASDLIAVRGLRRGPHLVLVSGAATAAWLALAGMKGVSYRPLLALLLLVNVGVVGSDVVCDGVMVEQGRRMGKTGVFQAVQLGVLYGALVVTGLGGGWLAAHATTSRIFLLAAAVQSLTLLSARWAREERTESPARPGLRALAALARDRRFWALSAVIFLWSFAPFLGTAQFYYQTEALKLDAVFIGWTITLGGLAGVAGAAFYGKAVGRRWSTAQLARAAVLIGAPLSLLYVLYLGRWSVALLSILFGFMSVGLRLALMDLAAQASPAGAEAASFAAYMSVFNLAASASNMTGAAVYQRITASSGPYSAVVVLAVIGAVATAACWPLLPYALRDDAARA